MQNGLDAERAALRRFGTVFGSVLWVAAGYVASGEVAATGWPAVGIAWIGAYPRGTHPLLETVAADLTAAGLEIADLAADTRGERDQIAHRSTTGPQYTGNSTAQSLTRAAPVETDFLNGEIVLAARLLGRDAPANAAVAGRVHRALREGTPAASLDDADLTATLPQLGLAPVRVGSAGGWGLRAGNG